MTGGVGVLGLPGGAVAPEDVLWDRLVDRWDLPRAPRADEVKLSFVPRGELRPHKLRFYVLSSWIGRLKGLLGMARDDARARPLALVGCASVHTVGMAFDIDVALVGADGHVVAARRGMRPGQVFGHRAAACALERPSEQSPWPEVGERLWSPPGWSWEGGWRG